jgi:hypothetical protein
LSGGKTSQFFEDASEARLGGAIDTCSRTNVLRRSCETLNELNDSLSADIVSNDRDNQLERLQRSWFGSIACALNTRFDPSVAIECFKKEIRNPFKM